MVGQGACLIHGPGQVVVYVGRVLLSSPGDSMATGLVVHELQDSSDSRGLAFSVHTQLVGFLGDVRDVHLMTLRPGSIRGNHYHASRRECILVAYTGTWILAWQTTPGGQTKTREFDGPGGVAIAVPPTVPHAIKNSGKEILCLVSLSNTPYLPTDPDSIRHVVVPD